MMDRHGRLAALGLSILLGLSLAQAWGQGRGGPVGRWIGQDGTDLVGRSSKVEPSGIQDIRIRIEGLPKGVRVNSARVAGHGGDEWLFNGRFGPWAAQLVQPEGATSADLYVEPGRAETGRAFSVELTMSDGRVVPIEVRGGRANPQLRSASAALKATWRGQTDEDRVGPGPAAGPDGVADLAIELERLTPNVGVKGVTVGIGRQALAASGMNPKGLASAELRVNEQDRTRGTLWFNPATTLKAGETLKVWVVYDNDTTDLADVKIGTIEGTKTVSLPAAPKMRKVNAKVRWVGQSAGDSNLERGMVQLSVDGLPRGEVVKGVALGDAVKGYWTASADSGFRVTDDPYASKLSVANRGRDQMDLAFEPYRDEAGASMTLRLLFADGSQAVVPFEGKACDPKLRAQPIGSRRVQVKPGDDLQRAVDGGGTVELAAGTYGLDRTLVLAQPTVLVGAPGATLVFRQPAGSAPWTAAIKIHAGGTRLEGFKIRFEGPVTWDEAVSFGPAVIGTTDDRDPGGMPAKAWVEVKKLDIEGPPARGDWDLAPRLFRLVTADGGVIEENRLRGGTIEIRNGPWTIRKNEFLATPAKTYAFSAISAHHTYDLVVEDNTATVPAGSGKVWRFLVMTVSGSGYRVAGNRVEGYCPLDNDGREHPNSPEVVLTEAYRLWYEGVGRVAEGGRVLTTMKAQGDRPARTGDVAAIVSGPAAGRWVRVAQPIDGQTYLLDADLPPGEHVVALAMGFIEGVFEGNTIDARGSTVAVPLVLAGNHYGTVVRGNTLRGGGEAYRLISCPTESPVHWGWSRAPFLGVEVTSNVIEDAAEPGRLAVEHPNNARTTRGRVYLTANLKDNRARWTSGFRSAKRPAEWVGFLVGDAGALDPKDLVATMSGTIASPPAGVEVARPLRIEAGFVNGKEFRGQSFPLPREGATSALDRPSSVR